MWVHDVSQVWQIRLETRRQYNFKIYNLNQSTNTKEKNETPLTQDLDYRIHVVGCQWRMGFDSSAMLSRLHRISTGGTGTHSAGKLTKTEVGGKEDSWLWEKEEDKPLVYFPSPKSLLYYWLLIYSIYLHPTKSKSLWLGIAHGITWYSVYMYMSYYR